MKKSFRIIVYSTLILSMFSLPSLMQSQSFNSQYLKHNYRFTPPSVTAEAYDLCLAIDSTYDGKDILVASMVLGDYSYYISPYSSDLAMGALSIVLFDKRHVSMDSNYIEIPQSIASKDLHSGEMTHIVNNNTVYLKNLDIKTAQDFEVTGKVRFVIEPKCTLENIEFRLTQKDGVLSVARLNEGC